MGEISCIFFSRLRDLDLDYNTDIYSVEYCIKCDFLETYQTEMKGKGFLCKRKYDISVNWLIEKKLKLGPMSELNGKPLGLYVRN